MRTSALVALVVCAAGLGLAAQEEKGAVGKSRVFEMRTYHAAEGKVDALHARFRMHTGKLFEKHGMTNIGYWVPIDQATGKATTNRLVYILAYPNAEARQAAWKAFQADPEWQKVKADSEVNGRLVERVDSVFLSATDYSPIE